MDFNSTGKNLKIFIEYNFLQPNWMSYTSWYSIYKMLPQAEVALVVQKSDKAIRWAEKCKVPLHFSLNNLCDSPHLLIQSNVVAVRKLDADWLKILNSCRKIFIGENIVFHGGNGAIDFIGSDHLCADVKYANTTSFVSYKNFGNFVLSEWIDNNVDGGLYNSNPLSHSQQFERNSDNEGKLLTLWNKAAQTYMMLEGK